jgi:ABC-type antimicrobial peptide transport system permease subunit
LIRERVMATLAGGLGALALVLASVGLYGLLSYTVASRTSEIGVRMALGASRGDVLWLVVGDAGRLIALGLMVGLPAALLSSRIVSSMLFGLTPTDPATLAGAAAVLGASSLLASLLPARRAVNVDPMVALRNE